METNQELLEFIKGRIRKRINSNTVIKRSLRTTEGREYFITKKSKEYLKGIQSMTALKLISVGSKYDEGNYRPEKERNKIGYTNEELAQIIDEFLISDDNRFNDEFSFVKLQKDNEDDLFNDEPKSSIRNMKKTVLGTLNKKDIKSKVMERVPNTSIKLNMIWELTNGQVYIKYFSKDFPSNKNKESIIRYIKAFRNPNKSR